MSEIADPPYSEGVSGRARSDSIRQILLLNSQVGVGYWFVAILTAGLANPLGMASPLWPAAGVAVVATLLHGARIWPGILIAEYLIAAHPPTLIYPPGGLPAMAAIGFSIANVAHAFVSARLIRRASGWPSALVEGTDAFHFVMACGPVGAAVGATIATASVAQFVDASLHDLPFTWWNFWVGSTLGAGLTAPLLLLVFGEPNDIWRARARSMLLPFGLAGILVTALLIATEKLETNQTTVQFETRAVAIDDAFEKAIDNNLDVLVTTRSFIRALPNNIDAAQFSAFARERLDRYPGIQALSWNPVIASDMRTEFEKRLHSEGFADFRISSREAGAGDSAAGLLEHHVVVTYIEPAQDNEDVQGLDIYASPVRRAAILAALQSGRMAATGPLQLVQDAESHVATLVVLPLLQPGAADRPVGLDRVRGFVVEVLSVEILVEWALGSFDMKGLDLRLADVTTAAQPQLLVRACQTSRGLPCNGAPPPVNPGASGLLWHNTFEMAGRQWQLTVLPATGYFADARQWSAWLAPGGAVVLALLIVAFLLIQTGTAYLDKVRGRELQIKNRELERFTYSVSHDLKSPLITIRGYVDCLAEDIERNDSERAKEDMRRIDEASKSMLQTLDGLLTLSRAGRLIDPSDAVNLQATLEEVCGLLKGPLDARGVQVVVTGRLPTITGDRIRLREVIQNLIENAVKFLGDQPSPRIEIGAFEQPGRWLIRIADNGIGIAPKFHGQIFELFERLETATEGSGIGLALSRRIIELHGGKIWVESEGAGRGTAVLFTLPTTVGPKIAVRARQG